MSEAKLLTVVVEEVARLLRERIPRLQHTSLSEVAGVVERILCREWSSVKPVTDKARVSGKCELVVNDTDEYIRYAVEEARRTANHLVDLAMEALAKHIEVLPEGLYSRLSWLIVSHAARVSNRLQRLASMLPEKPSLAPLLEISILLIALRAAAFYRLVGSLEPREVERLIEHLEAFIAACDLEEDALIEKLEKGVVAAIGAG